MHAQTPQAAIFLVSLLNTCKQEGEEVTVVEQLLPSNLLVNSVHVARSYRLTRVFHH